MIAGASGERAISRAAPVVNRVYRRAEDVGHANPFLTHPFGRAGPAVHGLDIHPLPDIGERLPAMVHWDLPGDTRDRQRLRNPVAASPRPAVGFRMP